MESKGRPAAGRRQRLAAGVILLAGVVGCTGGDPGDGDESAPPGQAEATSQMPTRALMGEVSGQLPRPARRAAMREVVEVVDAWMDAAHVGGEWPREVGAEAYDVFTPGARRAAQRDAALTSAAEIAESIEDVTVNRRVVRVDLVGARGRAVGATARVVLTYDATGERTRTVRVRGRLMLTRVKRDWKVFGHDLTEETR